MAADLADRLATAGNSVSLVSVHTMKPLDRAGIIDAMQRHKHTIVIEEHAPQGGLAAQVKQIAWDIQAKCTLDVFTLKDEFIHCYGSYENLLARHGLSLDGVWESIRPNMLR